MVRYPKLIALALVPMLGMMPACGKKKKAADDTTAATTGGVVSSSGGGTTASSTTSTSTSTATDPTAGAKLVTVNGTINAKGLTAALALAGTGLGTVQPYALVRGKDGKIKKYAVGKPITPTTKTSAKLALAGSTKAVPINFTASVPVGFDIEFLHTDPNGKIKKSVLPKIKADKATAKQAKKKTTKLALADAAIAEVTAPVMDDDSTQAAAIIEHLIEKSAVNTTANADGESTPDIDMLKAYKMAKKMPDGLTDAQLEKLATDAANAIEKEIEKLIAASAAKGATYDLAAANDIFNGTADAAPVAADGSAADLATLIQSADEAEAAGNSALDAATLNASDTGMQDALQSDISGDAELAAIPGMSAADMKRDDAVLRLLSALYNALGIPDTNVLMEETALGVYFLLSAELQALTDGAALDAIAPSNAIDSTATDTASVMVGGIIKDNPSGTTATAMGTSLSSRLGAAVGGLNADGLAYLLKHMILAQGVDPADAIIDASLTAQKAIDPSWYATNCQGAPVAVLAADSSSYTLGCSTVQVVSAADAAILQAAAESAADSTATDTSTATATATSTSTATAM